MTFVFKHPSKYKKVKEETMVKSFKEVEEIDAICEQQYQDEVISEAEYQGKTVSLNNPTRSLTTNQSIILPRKPKR